MTAAGPVLILASGSPRRRQLLGQLGLPFDVRPADVDETPVADESADDLVRRLAIDKAQAALAAAPEPDVVVLAADTVVAVDGEVLGKPVDAADATRMLRLLSGSRHQVLTGVAVAARHAPTADADLPALTSLAPGASIDVDVVVTHVTMREWSDQEIAAYVASGEPMDKAGSYAIQEIGDQFVTAVEGSFDNVVGLSVDVARRMLVEAGLELDQPPEV